jgi:hypothetical protein
MFTMFSAFFGACFVFGGIFAAVLFLIRGEVPLLFSLPFTAVVLLSFLLLAIYLPALLWRSYKDCRDIRNRYEAGELECFKAVLDRAVVNDSRRYFFVRGLEEPVRCCDIRHFERAYELRTSDVTVIVIRLSDVSYAGYLLEPLTGRE